LRPKRPAANDGGALDPECCEAKFHGARALNHFWTGWFCIENDPRDQDHLGISRARACAQGGNRPGDAL